jgi:hypothetical protein
MIQPTVRALARPTASARWPYVTTQPAGIEATNGRTASTRTSVTAGLIFCAPRAYGPGCGMLVSAWRLARRR